MKLKYLATAAFASLAIGATPAQAALKSITIGTNPSGSVFYLIGSGFAKHFQEKLQIRSTAQPYAGSSMYLPLVNSGEVKLGLASTIDTDLSYGGKAGFKDQSKNLRVIGQVWIIPYAYITRADSGIKTAEDLKGKRVMGDMPTSQALTLINTAIIESAGLKTTDVEFMRSGGLMDGVSAVVEGRADAAPVATSMPVLVKSNASTPGGLRIVANGKMGTDEFFSQHVPGTTASVAKPNEKQPHVRGETPVVSYATQLVTSADLSADDVYALTKSLHESWASLQKDIGPLRGVPANAIPLPKPTAPYHEGAMRYWKEAGLWTAAHEAAQKAF